MAREKYYTNLDRGLSGCIRAAATQDIEKGDIVYISRCAGRKVYVSLADSQYDKRSTGLLFVANQKLSAGYQAEFLTYMIVPYLGEGAAGDPIYLKKNGKWSEKKTKTSKPIGKILGGSGDELYALLAPQGRY